MGRVLFALLTILLAPTAATAKPTRDLSGEFRGDRYSSQMAYGGGYARDVARAVKKQRSKKKQKNYRPPGYPVVKRNKTLVGGLIREIRKALPRRGRGEPITFPASV